MLLKGKPLFLSPGVLGYWVLVQACTQQINLKWTPKAESVIELLPTITNCYAMIFHVTRRFELKQSNLPHLEGNFLPSASAKVLQ